MLEHADDSDGEMQHVIAECHTGAANRKATSAGQLSAMQHACSIMAESSTCP